MVDKGGEGDGDEEFCVIKLGLGDGDYLGLFRKGYGREAIRSCSGFYEVPILLKGSVDIIRKINKSSTTTLEALFTRLWTGCRKQK